MNLLNKPKFIGTARKLITGCFCALLVLCLCIPAQSQIVKIPFLGMVAVGGLYYLIHSRGKAVSKQVWIWFGLYLAYNLVWSVLGFVNNQPAVSSYFRLGVIWSVIFLFVIAVIDQNRIKWIDRLMIAVLAFQVICILLMIGYAFQLWPNVLKWLFPAARVGIHVGYVHVTGHFIGGMAFTVPYVYCRFVLGTPQKSWKTIVGIFLWLLVILVMVATSRRILLLVLLACTAATIVAACLRKESRRQKLIRAVVGMVLTCVFLGISAVVTSNMATSFLEANFEEIYQATYAHNHDESGNIKYLDGLVLDVSETQKYQQMKDAMNKPPVEPENPKPTEPNVSTKPQNPSMDAFGDRVNMLEDLTSSSVRGQIIQMAIKGWKTAPILGVGFGAELPGLEKEEGKGIYEMEFVVRLYTTGILGLALLLGLMIYIGVYGIRLMRKSKKALLMLAPCLVAYLGAVVATISNPYIFSGFDYLLMLFLPVAFINCAVKAEKESKAN